MRNPDVQDGSAAPPAAVQGAAPDWRGWAGFAVCTAAAAWAHRDFLTLEPRASVEVPLSAEVESFFFEPSDTSPALVLLFVGWLLYRRLRRLRRTLGHPGSPGLTAALLAAGVAVFAWARFTGAHDLQALALFFEGLGLAHAFGGMPALRIAAVPASLLIFAVPIPAPLLNEIVWHFQLWTAEYTGFLLHLIGQPALVSGDQILRSDQVFQIIEACSGLRTVETLAMLAVLMVDLFRRRGIHAGLLIAAALPVAFFVNGFRALTLIFNPHSDIATVHNAQGIAMLLGGVLILYGLDGLLERVLPQPPAPRHRPVADGSGHPSLRRAWLCAAGVLTLLGVLSVAIAPWERVPLLPARPDLHLPSELDGWEGVDRPPDRMFLGMASFSHILNRDYTKARQRVNVFIGVAGLGVRYRSFHTPKTALPTTGWIVEDERTERRDDGTRVDVLLVRRGTRRMLIHHWRQGTAGLAAETLRSSLDLDWSPIARSEVPVVVRLTTPVAGSEEGLAAGEARLDRWGELLRGSLKEMGTPRGR